VLVLLLAGLILVGPLRCSTGPATYIEEVERYRVEREERLRAEDGWLTLVGLFWLEAGENRLGSDPSNPIALPEGTAPPVAGSVFYDGSTARLVTEPAGGITFDGEPVTELDLGGPGTEPRVLRLGRLQFYLIERGGRHAIRVKDPENPAREQFGGLEYFPVDPGYRLQASFRPYDEPREIEVATVVGTARFLVPGRLEFTLHGQSLSLEPLVSDPSDAELFLIFKDATSGRETYGAGRYLYTTLDADEVELDFNKAYNPPCAFTPFATCPLPPPGNRLAVRIEAGEKRFAEGH
jgi:uncharacterized protein (DUF1684 family)